MTQQKNGPLRRIVGWLYLTEDVVLVAMVIAMVLFAVVQIVLRNFFDSGVLWIDPLLRVMLLWLGLIGALAASRTNKHIAIDILYRVLPQNWRPWMQSFTCLFAGAVCVLVAYHAARFVIDEYTYETIAFSGIPAWLLEIIIPFAFGVIGFRYFILSVLQLKAALSAVPVR